MRILIDNSQSFEIEIPKQVNLIELRGLVDKLNRFLKFIGKDELEEAASGNLSAVNPIPLSPRRAIKTREEAVEFVRKYYNRELPKERKVSDSIFYLRRKYNITPKEAGVKKFSHAFRR